MNPALPTLPSFSAVPWQMSFGERAVIEGVLAQLKPRLALEIGTAEGGSLSRISSHSDRVISFDLVEPQPDARALANVELRTGDSHVLLPRELQRLADDGDSVDFVLIDGDHSAPGARQDMEDILASPALKQAIVLAHDTLNQDVRRGLEEVPYAKFEKVAHVDLDFVGGYVPAEPPLRGECWGGLGLVIVDDGGDFGTAHEGRRVKMTPLPQLVWASADALRDDGSARGNGAAPGSRLIDAEQQLAELPELERRLEEVEAEEEKLRGESVYLKQTLDEVLNSPSWRLTQPLRQLRARLTRDSGKTRAKA